MNRSEVQKFAPLCADARMSKNPGRVSSSVCPSHLPVLARSKELLHVDDVASTLTIFNDRCRDQAPEASQPGARYLLFSLCIPAVLRQHLHEGPVLLPLLGFLFSPLASDISSQAVWECKLFDVVVNRLSGLDLLGPP